jgi:hypothetical protein
MGILETFLSGASQILQSSGNNNLPAQPGNFWMAQATDCVSATWVEVLGKTHPRSKLSKLMIQQFTSAVFERFFRPVFDKIESAI